MSNRLMDALSSLARCEQRLSAGEVLFHAGAPVSNLYLVVSGALRLTRVLPHGSELILQRAEKGAIIAEGSLLARAYCCNGVATETSVVRAVPMDGVRTAFRNDCDLLREWIRHLAYEVQHARARAEILSMKTVAERLDGWQSLHDGVLPPKGRWRQLACEIGVSPEALYRELARRGRLRRRAVGVVLDCATLLLARDAGASDAGCALNASGRGEQASED